MSSQSSIRASVNVVGSSPAMHAPPDPQGSPTRRRRVAWIESCRFTALARRPASVPTRALGVRRLPSLALALVLAAESPAVLAQGSLDQSAAARSPQCGVVLSAAPKPQPLTQVLARIAAVEPFRIEYWAKEDPMVRQPAGAPVDVIAGLAQSGNVMVRYAKDPRCPGRWRVDTVWVVPSGHAHPSPAASPGSKRESSERAAADRIATEQGLSTYLRAHGLGGKPAPASAPEASAP